MDITRLDYSLYSYQVIKQVYHMNPVRVFTAQITASAADRVRRSFHSDGILLSKHSSELFSLTYL